MIINETTFSFIAENLHYDVRNLFLRDDEVSVFSERKYYNEQARGGKETWWHKSSHHFHTHLSILCRRTEKAVEAER